MQKILATLFATLLAMSSPLGAQGRGPVDQPPVGGQGHGTHAGKHPRKGKPDPARTDKTGALPRGQHRPVRGIAPRRALRHLQDGNEAFLITQAMPAWRRPIGEAEPPIKRDRPAGCGPLIAAVIQPAGLSRPAQRLLTARYKDLLLLTSPAPRLRAAEVAAIETASDKGLSLAVVLVREADPLFAPRNKRPHTKRTTSQQILDRHIDAAREHAKRTRLSVAAAHGMLQAQVLWRSSEKLRMLRRKGRFEVAVGAIQESGQIVWITRWHQRPTLVTTEAVRRRAAERAAKAKKGAHKKARPAK